MIISYLFWTKVSESNQILWLRGLWTVSDLDDDLIQGSSGPNPSPQKFEFSIYLDQCVGLCPFNNGSGRCYIHAFIFQKSSRRTKLYSFTCILFIFASFNFKTCRWDSFLSNASTSSCFINKTQVSFHRCLWRVTWCNRSILVTDFGDWCWIRMLVTDVGDEMSWWQL